MREKQSANPDQLSTASLRRSEEADRRGLELAREQGRALHRTLEHMANDVAQNGSEQQVGEYLVGYAVERAEGLYHWTDGELVWREPESENIHVEISVRDSGDGRFLPGLNVTVTLLDSQDNEIGTHTHPFLWHPYLNHYGRNWNIPKTGNYTIRVHIDVPEFPRHDKVNGKRFTKPVDTEFRAVSMQAGRE